MRILGIETSCDETAAAVVEDGTRVRSSVVTSSQDVFARSGGVIPEDAARRQLECVIPVLRAAMAEAKTQPDDIDAIAVTRGPGLLGSLLVGVTAARALAALWKKPLIGVHHTFGHLSSVWLDATTTPAFACVTLSASGGHTDLWYRTSHTEGSLIGSTRDDAAGEAFDKGAAMLDLPYPGGPAISAAADTGNERYHRFPVALTEDDTCDFSFSGLKTALRYALRDLKGTPTLRRDLAASYQYAICAQLSDRIGRALRLHPDAKELHVVGGVSANRRLRSLLAETFPSVTIRTPMTLAYCTDNAAMIAGAAAFLHKERGEAAFARFTTAATEPLRSAFV